MSDTTNCQHCAARFEGDDAAKAYKAHLAGFHPAGAPVERVVQTPADIRAVGKDFGPAISDISSWLGDHRTAIEDLQERVQALESGRRSDTDLAVLADQVAPRLGQTTLREITSQEPAADEGPSYRDLQAQAKVLGIPATGNREELAVAIAAEELRLAEEAAASRSGEGSQGGDSSPAGDPDASATGEAGTPPAS